MDKYLTKAEILARPSNLVTHLMNAPDPSSHPMGATWSEWRRISFLFFLPFVVSRGTYYFPKIQGHDNYNNSEVVI